MPNFEGTFQAVATSEAALPGIANDLLKAGSLCNVWAFDGEMGAGKTTLIKAICAALGTKDHVSSPTFAIINEYRNDRGQSIYHFDCYRLSGEDEALSIGAEEYFYSGQQCLVEWPSRISGLLPSPFFLVGIKPLPNGDRHIDGRYVHALP
jgi:tRNA threonylcarbamoyladenosine biosynthesis protein TsaE